VGKASLVAFLALPVLAIVLITGATLGARAQGELAAQVLGSVLAAAVAAVLSSDRQRKRHG
jgi:hypothetical protein